MARKSPFSAPEQARVISSSDRLTVETIADYARQIREELASATTVTLEFVEDVEMDITALQVLCSACSTASAAGKRVLHRGPVPNMLAVLTQAAGAECLSHCQYFTGSCFRYPEQAETPAPERTPKSDGIA